MVVTKLEKLKEVLHSVLGGNLKSIDIAFNEVTVIVKSADYLQTMLVLRDHPELCFEELIDLFGTDYSSYDDGAWDGPRFAVTSHLLSLRHNWRVRVRVFAQDDNYPTLDSLNNIWASANWYEREAFDLFGVLFKGHDDLRRILTDYGFTGHPFRKDFPVSGYVEMHYDSERKKVVYRPVSIDEREITPRVIHKENVGAE